MKKNEEKVVCRGCDIFHSVKFMYRGKEKEAHIIGVHSGPKGKFFSLDKGDGSRYKQEDLICTTYGQ